MISLTAGLCTRLVVCRVSVLETALVPALVARHVRGGVHQRDVQRLVASAGRNLTIEKEINVDPNLQTLHIRQIISSVARKTLEAPTSIKSVSLLRHFLTDVGLFFFSLFHKLLIISGCLGTLLVMFCLKLMLGHSQAQQQPGQERMNFESIKCDMLGMVLVQHVSNFQEELQNLFATKTDWKIDKGSPVFHPNK